MTAAIKNKDNIFSKTWRLFAGIPHAKSENQERPTFEYDTVTLITKAGIHLKGWYCQGDSIDRGTVILFHSLSGNKSTVLHQAYEFRYLGFNVLMIDARGHGESGGGATTIGFHEAEDVKLAYELIQAKGEQHIYLWGYSLGAVEILKAVADYSLSPAGLILEGPFLSLQSHIKGRARTSGFPQQPYSFLVSLWIGIENGFNAFSFNTAKYASRINCPVLLLYGLRDQLVKQYEIEEIYSKLNATEKKLVEFPQAYHEPLLSNDPALWRTEVEHFLESNR